MTTAAVRIGDYLVSLPVFFGRQAHDWKVAVIQQAVNRFFYRLSLPYLSIYIVALGATKTQLGLVNSIGLLIGGLVGPLAGWLVDRTGVRRVFMTGVGGCALAYLVYAVAGHWVVALVATGVYWLGMRVASTGCSTVCASSLKDSDRAAGMNLCSALSSVMLIFGPLAGVRTRAHGGGRGGRPSPDRDTDGQAGGPGRAEAGHPRGHAYRLRLQPAPDSGA
ncbi:MAG: MFS transporter [Gemmatimonadetes bacterium]|nr:MFS transporter [Gemmatimonadota bacterium]